MTHNEQTPCAIQETSKRISYLNVTDSTFSTGMSLSFKMSVTWQGKISDTKVNEVYVLIRSS